MLDVHTQRVVAGFDNIPGVVLILLVFSAALSLAMTAYNGALNGTPLRWRVAAFALILTAIIVIIMDFDMPLRGLIQPQGGDMEGLIEKMEVALAS